MVLNGIMEAARRSGISDMTLRCRIKRGAASNLEEAVALGQPKPRRAPGAVQEQAARLGLTVNALYQRALRRGVSLEEAIALGGRAPPGKKRADAWKPRPPTARANMAKLNARLIRELVNDAGETVLDLRGLADCSSKREHLRQSNTMEAA